MNDHPYLTHREQEALAFLIVGKTNREIAAELKVSVPTVKVGVSNRTEAALVGLRMYPLLRALAS